MLSIPQIIFIKNSLLILFKKNITNININQYKKNYDKIKNFTIRYFKITIFFL